MPVRNLRTMAADGSWVNQPKIPFTIAPPIAVSVKRCRGLMMSGRLKSALKSVPATNPICTDRVNHPAAVGLKCHSLVREGTTADPLNHNDMPSSSATASKVSVRQRFLDSLRETVAGFCKPQIVYDPRKTAVTISCWFRFCEVRITLPGTEIVWSRPH